MSHEDDCITALAFPATISNRPALPRIQYRVGDYASVREALLRWRDLAPELTGWTHRGADDPGVALLECTAVIADVLAFYQELYANECFLRTAAWRESVADLVRLTGYRLAPAVGGRAVLAAQVTGDAPVTIARGAQVSVPLAGGTATFETTTEHVAQPWLDEVPLHAFADSPDLASTTRSFAIAGEVSLRRGDRLYVVGPAFYGGSFAPGGVLVVEAARHALGMTLVDVRGDLPLLGLSYRELTVYRIGRTHRHFGHNAPRTPTSSFARSVIDVTPDDSGLPPLQPAEIPLDTRLDAPPGDVLCVVMIGDLPLTYVRRVVSATARCVTWGLLSATTTVLALDEGFDPVVFEDSRYYDIRLFEIHERLAGPWTITGVPAVPAAGTTGRHVRCYGTGAEAELLRDRPLLFVGDGEPSELHATPLDVSDPDTLRLRDVELDRDVDLAAFAWSAPTARVLGNLVEASEGATQLDVRLGSGDARVAWQTLRIPKAPLTYLVAPTGCLPELELRVDGHVWRRVDSLVGSGPADEVYVVREDDAGASYVQAGDGTTGKRFPSGTGNIVARYRTGAGAFGPLRDGAVVRASRRVPGLDRFELPGGATGGAPAETVDGAKRAAPARMQSLGRLVSLADYEAEALALAGVEEAAARWDDVDGVSSIVVTVLMTRGRDAEIAAVTDALLAAERCRGPRRHPIVVVRGTAEYVYITLAIALAAGVRREDVEPSIAAALGAGGVPGLFGPARRFGEPEYAARVIGLVQNVTGVRWVALQAFGSPGVLATAVACAPDRVLRLETAALELVVTDGVSVECAR